MSFFKLTLSTSLLFSLFLSGTCVANDFYNTSKDVIRHYYQPGKNAASPWHKKTADEQEVADYYVCYDKVVNQNAGFYLIVMGRDANLVVMVDCQIPADDLVVHFL